MAEGPEYLILKPPLGWLDGKKWRCLLGAAVKYPWTPLREYVPDNPLSYMVNDDQLEEHEYQGFILGQDVKRTSSWDFSVTGLGKLRSATSVHDRLNLNGKVIYVKSLTKHTDFWKNITDKEDFRLTVTDWLRDKTFLGFGKPKYQVCLVTGVLLCQDVSVAVSEKEAEEREKKGEIPLGTIVEAVAASQGAPVSLGGTGNVAAATSATQSGKTFFAAQGTDLKFFGLEPRIISVKGGSLQLSDDAPRSAYKLGAKSGQSDDSSGELELKQLETQEWEQLLREGDNY